MRLDLLFVARFRRREAAEPDATSSSGSVLPVCSMHSFFPGDHGARAIPVPIPNTEVKTRRGDGTASLGGGRVARCQDFFRPHRFAGAVFLWPDANDRERSLSRTPTLGGSGARPRSLLTPALQPPSRTFSRSARSWSGNFRGERGKWGCREMTTTPPAFPPREPGCPPPMGRTAPATRAGQS